jgi:hypothetical protein
MIFMCSVKEMEALKAAVARFSRIDNLIREKNAELGPLRVERKAVEVELVRYFSQPEYAAFKQVDIREDGSVLKIDREPKAPWSLSRRELIALEYEFTRANPQGTAGQFCNFLLTRRDQSRAKEGMAIERVVR